MYMFGYMLQKGVDKFNEAKVKLSKSLMMTIIGELTLITPKLVLTLKSVVLLMIMFII